MFEDQTVELLPARTTMKRGGGWSPVIIINQVGNVSIALAINAGNINFGGTQFNIAEVLAAAGVNAG